MQVINEEIYMFKFSQTISQYHMHTGEMFYSFDICGNKFAKASGFQRHFHILTGDRPYLCDVCGKKLPRPVVFVKVIPSILITRLSPPMVVVNCLHRAVFFIHIIRFIPAASHILPMLW